MSKIFVTPPKVIYRQPPNLKDLLVRARLPRNTPLIWGIYRLHDRNCVTCEAMSVTDSFKSIYTGQVFKILGTFNCTSIGVICCDCGKQYVGETGSQLRQRHRGHRQELKKANNPLGKHFNAGCTYFNLIAIQSVEGLNKTQREQKELFWIHQLHTFAPKGINIRKSNRP